ncbi:hypothetical protein [Shewanella colwelliana]|uniref:hypothetical protein n=1 Tax=Shewanella colwelliana TaxID=23 RepID=UPI0022AFA2E8|nr:hypothetical protein [Shewanella colwelliana]MCZ4337723.1 hypothetical protein [Shewanella colwelliana]
MKWFLQLLGAGNKLATPSRNADAKPHLPIADLEDIVNRLQLVTKMMLEVKNSSKATNDAFNQLCRVGVEVNTHLNSHIVKISQGGSSLISTTALSKDMKAAENWIRSATRYINSTGESK